MRNALSAVTDELRRLKASGVGSVSVSQEGLEALRAAVKARPRAAAPAPAAPAAEPAAPPRARPAEKPPREPEAPVPVVVLPEGDKAARFAALCRMVEEDPVCRSKLRPGKRICVGVGNLDAAIPDIAEHIR